MDPLMCPGSFRIPTEIYEDDELEAVDSWGLKCPICELFVAAERYVAEYAEVPLQSALLEVLFVPAHVSPRPGECPDPRHGDGAEPPK